ncbi:helix-turn-helix transcriptional regulator [Pandoraea sp. NPDC090278]|uniref:helix-turn-helix transcriptional regulator n=1 Tax=Pandoraea sp. NPDC090278 TaxID=3364391 RepID=UPI00383BC034
MTISANSGEFAPLIDDLYAAALGDQSWDAALQRLRRMTGTRLVSLLAHVGAHQQTIVSASAGDDDRWALEAQSAYATQYQSTDPMLSRLPTWQPGQWAIDTEFTTERERSRSEFYQDYMCAHELGSISALLATGDQQTKAFLSLVGAPGAGGVTDESRRQIAALYPHISRALRVHHRLGELAARADVAEASLQALTFPIWLFDGERTLVWMNPAGTAFAQQESALRFSKGRLAIPGCSTGTEWQSARNLGGVLLRRTNGMLLPLALLPVPERSQLSGAGRGPLTMMTAAELGQPRARQERLRVYFQLTPAESELAVLLCCDGMTPEECAAARDVSINTVRSQIKTIQQKVGVTRTSQLTRLVAQI